MKKYRGMGSLEAMTKGSLGDTAKLKIAQGVVGSVADKGSVLKFVPYTMRAVKQGFQDLGASSLQSAHYLLRSGILRLEVCLFHHCYIVGKKIERTESSCLIVRGDLTLTLVLVLDQVRTGAAQVEGGVHGLVGYEKKCF